MNRDGNEFNAMVAGKGFYAVDDECCSVALCTYGNITLLGW